MVVRCTKKVLDLLGGDVTLTEPAPSDDDWYLNLLWIERRKCLLLTHSGTLFSVFRAAIRVAELRPLGDYAVEAIETELRAEHLPAATFSQLDPTDVRIAKTARRSTLGYMKKMAFELEWSIASEGGLDESTSTSSTTRSAASSAATAATTPDQSNSSTRASPTRAGPPTPDRRTAYQQRRRVSEPYGLEDRIEGSRSNPLWCVTATGRRSVQLSPRAPPPTATR